MLPTHGRYAGDGIGQGLPLGRRSLEQLLVQAQAVPAHNQILDQSGVERGDTNIPIDDAHGD